MKNNRITASVTLLFLVCSFGASHAFELPSSNSPLRYFGTAENDSAGTANLAADSKGNIYLVGYTEDPEDYESGSGILIKFNANGVVQWSRQSESSDTRFRQVLVDPSDDLYVSFEWTPKVTRVSSDGEEIWTRVIEPPEGLPSPERALITRMSTDSEGVTLGVVFYVAATKEDLPVIAGQISVSSVVRLTTDGVTLWRQNYFPGAVPRITSIAKPEDVVVGQAASVMLRGIAADREGGVVLVGSVLGVQPSNAFYAHLDSMGREVITRAPLETGLDEGYSWMLPIWVLSGDNDQFHVMGYSSLGPIFLTIDRGGQVVSVGTKCEPNDYECYGAGALLYPAQSQAGKFFVLEQSYAPPNETLNIVLVTPAGERVATHELAALQWPQSFRAGGIVLIDNNLWISGTFTFDGLTRGRDIFLLRCAIRNFGNESACSLFPSSQNGRSPGHLPGDPTIEPPGMSDAHQAWLSCKSDPTINGPRFQVSTDIGLGGRASPDDLCVRAGDTAYFSLIANTGYELWQVGGCNGQLEADDVYVTGPVTNDCKVTAYFGLRSYFIPINIGVGGVVDPSYLFVRHGESGSFQITPDAGYEIAAVEGCDGTLEGNIYTTGSVETECEIDVQFVRVVETFVITAIANPGGSITPSSIEVTPGTVVTLVVIPSIGNAIDSVEGCDGELDGNTYVLGPITADCTVVAKFKTIFVDEEKITCVNDGVSLESALNEITASNFARRNIIQLEAGNYIRGDQQFQVHVTQGAVLEIEGGFQPGCVTKTAGATSTLDGDGKNILSIDLTDGSSAKLKDFSVRNGSGGVGVPGGIRALPPVNWNGELLEIENVNFENNFSGALDATLDAVTIRNSSFIGNHGSGRAPIRIDCRTCIVENSIFNDNIAENDLSQTTGALHIQTAAPELLNGEALDMARSIVVSGNQFFNNSGIPGALNVSARADVEIKRNSFFGNRGGESGAGGAASLFLMPYSDSVTILGNVSANFFQDNHDPGGRAGALFVINDNSDLTLDNNLFSGNLGYGGGDAVWMWTVRSEEFPVLAALPITRFVNNTIIANGDGSSAEVIDCLTRRDADATIVFRNNVIAFNNIYSAALNQGCFNPDTSSTTTFIQHNAFDSLPTFSEAGDKFVLENNIEIDASAFRDLAIQDFRPADASPLIDGGFAYPEAPAVDIVGNSRDAVPDIGAFEFSEEN